MEPKSRRQLSIGTGDRREGRAFETLGATSDTMRDLRRLRTGAVAVVTFVGERGFRGVTVSDFCIVSLDPGKVLFCLDREGEAIEVLSAAGKFAIAILSDSQ